MTLNGKTQALKFFVSKVVMFRKVSEKSRISEHYVQTKSTGYVSMCSYSSSRLEKKTNTKTVSDGRNIDIIMYHE